MKKIISVALSALMLLSFAACTNTPAKSEETPQIGMANPVVEYTSIEEAQKVVGFTIKTITAIPDGFSQDQVSVVGATMVQILYKSGYDTISYRMAEGTDDISGDYTKYENEKDCKTTIGDVKIRGTKDGYQLAAFTDDKYTYSLYVDKPMSEPDFLSMVESIK